MSSPRRRPGTRLLVTPGYGLRRNDGSERVQTLLDKNSQQGHPGNWPVFIFNEPSRYSCFRACSCCFPSSFPQPSTSPVTLHL